MSDLMLHAVLEMPPELWSGDAIDVAQRHGRYRQASERIRDDAAALATANERIRELESQLDANSELLESEVVTHAQMATAYAAEREVSDKLERALSSLLGPACVLVDGLDDGREIMSLNQDIRAARAALAEVSAIRAKQGGEG